VTTPNDQLEKEVVMDMTREQVGHRIVKIGPVGSEDASGLGIVSEERLFTTASHLPNIGIGAFQEAELDATLVTTGAKETLVQYLATSYDLMVMGHDSLEVINEDGGGYDILVGIEDERELPPLPPAKVEIAGETGSPIKGYIFLSDGKTTHDIEFTPSMDYPFIYAKLDEDLDLTGAAGGPLMSADHQLVGIVQGVFSGLLDEDGNTYSQLKAVQLDLALPEFLRRAMNWTTLSI
jgi:hypothetical protein